jgi:N-ethylmaleimide reductase
MKKTLSFADPLKLGQMTLKNRVILSALTRARCDPDKGIPTDLLAIYYGQRAGAGLCFTESTAWCERGRQTPGAAELFNKQQAEGWRKVTDAVHSKGGHLFVQMFHGGRATHPLLNGDL